MVNTLRHAIQRYASRSAAPLWVLAISVAALAGCHQDMWNQPRYTPLQASTFFDDGASSRPIPEGTVPYHGPKSNQPDVNDDHFYLGRVNGQYAKTFPPQIKINNALLARGQQRFGIYCTPCHGQAGMGDGMVVQRGFQQPPDYHIARLRSAPPGYFFDVITNGFGRMFSYASRVQPRDRWAIVAYIRALQLSQMPYDQMSPEDKAQVDAQAKKAKQKQQSQEDNGTH